MPAKHPMKIRFQADADLNAEIVAGVLRREPGIDFQTADEVRLRGLLDPEVLALAAQENRILVTHDRRTMPRHFADYLLHHSYGLQTFLTCFKRSNCHSFKNLSAFL